MNLHTRENITNKIMEKRKVRVRFAPSPTGPLHMGGVRTALYNYLFAKQNGGDFILRIEDTDSQRFVAGAEKYIIESLKWCGISPDEGVDENGNMVDTPSERHPNAPYRQSQRKELYKKYAQELIQNGHAYYAFDSAEELNELRSQAEANGETFTYNYITRLKLRNSLTLSQEEVSNLLENTTSWTIRFKNPEDRVVKMQDLIRGSVEFNTNTLDDKVIWKCADQLPTYHLANIVDDHLMDISHVIRGEEWLPSLPLHYMLYEALGWQDTQPEFAHLSLLLKPDGKGKLSKRDGDRLGFPVFPLEWRSEEGEISRGYREDGYYPEAFINIIALLGWNPGNDQEILSMEELIKFFSLDKVVKAGARFNQEKAKWFNQEYLRMRSNQELADEFKCVLEAENISYDPSKIEDICSLIKERAYFIQDFIELSSYFFVAPKSYDEKVVAKFWKDEIPQCVTQVANYVVSLEDFSVENIDSSMKSYIQENGLAMGKVMNSIRLALVGASMGPGVADIIYILGKDEFIKRINTAINTLVLQ